MDRARAMGDPAPWMKSHAATLSAISTKVAYGVRIVSFSSRYGNIDQVSRVRAVARSWPVS